MELAIYLYNSKGDISNKGEIYNLKIVRHSPARLAYAALENAAEHGWDSCVITVTEQSLHSNCYIFCDENTVFNLATDEATRTDIQCCMSKLKEVLKYQLIPEQETIIRENYHLNGFLECLPHSRKVIFLDNQQEIPDSIKLKYHAISSKSEASKREPEMPMNDSVVLDADDQKRANKLVRILNQLKHYITVPHPTKRDQYYNPSDYPYITTIPFPEYVQIKPTLTDIKAAAKLKSFLSQHPRLLGVIGDEGDFWVEFSSHAYRRSSPCKLDDLVAGLLHNTLLWGESDAALAFERSMASLEIPATEVYVLNSGDLPAGEVCAGVRILEKFRSSNDIWKLTSRDQESDINNSYGFDSYIRRSILTISRNIKFHFYAHTENLDNKVTATGEGFSVTDFLKSLSLVANTNLRSQFSWVKIGIEAGFVPFSGGSRGLNGDVDCEIRKEDIEKAYDLSRVTLKDDVKEICDYAVSQKLRARSGDFRHALKNIFTTLELIYIKDTERGSKKDKIARRMACHLEVVDSKVISEIVEGLYEQRTKANHSGDLKVDFSDKIVVDGNKVIVGRLVEHLEVLCIKVIEKLINENDLTPLQQIIDNDINSHTSNKTKFRSKKNSKKER
ncbi:hypothetical protein MACH09_16500 [Vibrio sp. MACH09]|uniref:hypothetical protein n=1 Tax=Vibrio sp. MACH09 TaxID=3025122 RepID=UPI00279181F7|nr:hypothetical protein [Vibrio sp. MACH09]GLO61142.1 hypothetical protein MACH09_16500 [Vibrio sp. MACH09]